jgi:multiple sugar transport system substrate-binding protein
MKITHKSLMILFITTLAVTACQAKATPTTVPDEKGTRVIRVGTGDGGDDLSPHQEIIALYEADHPDVLIPLEVVGGGDYNNRLLTQLSAKAAPDVMEIGDEAVPSFVAQGAFIPLENYLPEDFDPSIYLPGLLEPGQVDGVQYLLPKDYSPLAVYYNKTIFDAAGIAYPEDGWTWDDFLDTALELTQDTDGDNAPDIWGVQLPGSWTTCFEYWVAAAGGSLISEDGEDFIGVMDSEEVVRAATFYADLYNKYRIAPPPADLTVIDGGNTEFADGKAAMVISGRWSQSELLGNPNINLGVAAPPQDAVRANILFWNGFGVAATSEHPKTAAYFLSFYAGEQGAEIWQDWTLPSVTSVADSSGLSADPIEGVWINELNYLVPRAYTFTNYWDETAVPALQNALETAILEKNADIQAIMTQAAQEAQTALDTLLAEN